MVRYRLIFAGSIFFGVASVALVLNQAYSSPPVTATTQPANRSIVTVTSAADTGSGSLRNTLRFAPRDLTVNLQSDRVVNRSDLEVSVPGTVLHGRPQARAQIGGRQTVVTASDVTLRDLEFFGDPDINGRSLLIIGNKKTVSNVVVENVVVHAGGDDGAGCWGRFRNITFRDCTFKSDTYKPCNKALILGADSGTPQPDVGADQGYAATFIRCKIAGCYGNPRCSGGVYVFRDCEIDVTSLGGAILMGAKVNFINCRFNTFAKPADAPYWYCDIGPAPIVVSGRGPNGGERNDNPSPDTIYIENCTINGTPATPAQLCALSGPKGYQELGSVPSNVFRKTPW